eukprot:13334501-Alexandrium_andersonii.AAC.1
MAPAAEATAPAVHSAESALLPTAASTNLTVPASANARVHHARYTLSTDCAGAGTHHRASG